MKQIFITICFTVFLFAKLTKAANATNTTNTSIPTNSCSNATHVQLTTLYIGTFFDLSKKDGYGSLPMAQQAIEEINNNTDLLPGYRLELVVKSTQVSYKNVYCMVNPQGRQYLTNEDFSGILIAVCLARNLFISRAVALPHWANFCHQERGARASHKIIYISVIHRVRGFFSCTFLLCLYSFLFDNFYFFVSFFIKWILVFFVPTKPLVTVCFSFKMSPPICSWYGETLHNVLDLHEY